MAEPVGAGRNKKKRKGERKTPGCNGLNWAVDLDTERDSHEEVCSNNAAVLLLMKALECFLSNRPLCTAGTLSSAQWRFDRNTEHSNLFISASWWKNKSRYPFYSNGGIDLPFPVELDEDPNSHVPCRSEPKHY